MRNTLESWALMWVLSAWTCSTAPAAAQTIGDFSRSQRAVIEAEIVKNNARAMERPPAVGPAPAEALEAQTALAAKRLREPQALEPSAAQARVVVSGVFVAPSRSVAEVIVDGGVHMLTQGQDVPGTSWRLQSILVDKVVLVDRQSSTRVGPAGTVRAHPSRSLVFHLPSPMTRP